MIVGVDPGLNHPAVAILYDDGKTFRTYIHTHNQKKDLIDRYYELNYGIRKIFESIANEIDIYIEAGGRENWYCIIEQPQYFGTGKGTKSAERQDLVKLITSFGIILSSVFKVFSFTRICLVTPIEWKGNLPKKVTRKRMEQLHGTENIKNLSDDEVDALALAHYFHDNSQQILK